LIQLTTSKISDRVYLIDTLALGEKNSVAAYLLKGSKTALVDCGYATSAEVVLEGLKELNLSPAEIDYVIPTHVHLDHAGAAGYLVERMPRAKVIAHERGVPHLVDPSRLIQSATSVFGEEMIRMYGAPKGIPAERITSVGEEMHIDLGGLSLTVIHSPGHAPHQISVYVEEEKVLIAADAVGIIYPSLGVVMPTTPPPSLNPAELGRTADRLGQMDSRLLLAPHFGVRSDPKEVLAETKRKTDGWVSDVREMKKTGVSPDGMAANLKTKVSREAGVPEEGFPLYADISIRTSVMGILHYLEKNP
jgi:glyoxylase-like metal-dependent hydrolase (beta-lactamase superfamily II)